MSNHPWDADASVFLYPPLGSDDADPEILFRGTVGACFDMDAKLLLEMRANVAQWPHRSKNGQPVERIENGPRG